MDSLGVYKGLRYRPSPSGDDATTPAALLRTTWKPSELKSGQILNQPSPLFKKLDESVIEEERARLGN